jgi:hypothetical protein
MMKNARRKKITNLSDDELAALESLKRNADSVVCKAGKGDCIVVMNYKDYINKANTILAGKQFGPISRSTSLEKKEKAMNEFLRELYDADLIEKKVFGRLYSTSTSLSVMYG